MIELFCFGLILPPKIRALAKPRGESTLRWWAISLGIWIVVQLALTALLLLTAFVLSVALDRSFSSQELAGPLAIYYLVATFTGIAIGERYVLRRLSSLPVLDPDLSDAREVES